MEFDALLCSSRLRCLFYFCVSNKKIMRQGAQIQILLRLRLQLSFLKFRLQNNNPGTKKDKVNLPVE